jgi:NTE family protein
MKKNIGIVFSGGGARTLAHVGLLKALEEEDVNITHVSGTSSGAIIAALFAANYKADEILDFFNKTVLFKTSFYAASQPGFLSTNEYSAIFKQYFRRDDFDALHKKLYVAATDILNARSHIFHEGKLVQALLASAAYPMVFKPVEIKGKLYFDGGITNDFPIEPIRWQCEKVIGSYVTPLTPMNKLDLEKPQRLLQRAYDVSSMTNSASKFAQCDVVIQPDKLGEFGFFETRRLDEIFHIGYLAGKEQMEKIKAISDSIEESIRDSI